MTELAGHLVDRVLPEVPVRQWVLSLPWSLRYLLAFDAALCRDVLAVFIRVVFGWLRRRAAGQGVADGQCGAVTVIQRFGYRRSYCDLLHEQRLDRPPSCGFRAVSTRPRGARASWRCPRQSPATTPDGAPGSRCARPSPARA